jgi:hypothetical protein
MTRRWFPLALFVAGVGFSSAAWAQDPVPPALPPPPSPSEPPPVTLKERLQKADQAGGLHLSEHWAVVFGGIKQGSGIALGPAFSQKFADDGFLQLKAVYSLKQFSLLQARYDTRPLWSGRGTIVNRVRWQDAPELPLYALGMPSPDARVDYGERRMEAGSRVVFKVTPVVSVTGGFGVEQYATTGGRLDLSEDEALMQVPPAPGLAIRPWFAHTFVAAAFDSRTSPDYSRRGRFIEAGIHDFHDWKDGQDSFRRVELAGQQLIPTFGERGVIDLSARAWLSQSSDATSVPFFLMPALGGGDTLRAFPSYRFRDRNALLLKGEYRWAVHAMADVAGVYEAGKVAPDVGGLALEDMAHSVAVGIRVHSKTSSLFRADLAHGREGFGFRVGFSAGGS